MGSRRRVEPHGERRLSDPPSKRFEELGAEEIADEIAISREVREVAREAFAIDLAQERQQLVAQLTTCRPLGSRVLRTIGLGSRVRKSAPWSMRAISAIYLGDLSRRFIPHLKLGDAILTSVREDLVLGVGEHGPPDRYAVDDRARADTAEINRRAALRRKGWGRCWGWDWGCRC